MQAGKTSASTLTNIKMTSTLTTSTMVPAHGLPVPSTNLVLLTGTDDEITLNPSGRAMPDRRRRLDTKFVKCRRLVTHLLTLAHCPNLGALKTAPIH